jgi:type III pantothenate kinase
MLFAFDVGNTNITIGGYDGDDLSFTTHIASDTRLTADSYAVAVEAVLRLHGAAIGEIYDWIIWSAVPSIT